MEYQDYYKTLGVERTASQEDIRRAYRKLARKYHPDVSTEPDAETKFKQLNEAHRVLKDPEARKRYDALGANWREGQEFRPPEGFRHYEFHFGGAQAAEGFSDFFQSLFGGLGFGAQEDIPGAGTWRRHGRDQQAQVEISLEEAARGCRRRLEFERTTWDDQGNPKGESAKFDVNIPPGATEGSTIRLAGKGEPGLAGAPPGDLYLHVRLRADPRFRVAGHNLLSDIDLAPWEAALGTEVAVGTLDGSVKMKIPPGTSSGKTFRLRGKGLPRRTGAPGDLLVATRIVVPASLTTREKELFEQLAEDAQFKARA